MGQYCFENIFYQEIRWYSWCLYPPEGDSVTGFFATIGGKTCKPEAVLEKSVNRQRLLSVTLPAPSAIN